MRKKIFAVLALSLCAFSCFALTGCGSNEKFDEVGKWSLQKVNTTYTTESLSEMTNEQLNALVNTYIKVKITVSYVGMQNNLYYSNFIETAYVNDIKVYGYSYQNYWEIPFKNGDEIYVEGYVSDVSISTYRVEETENGTNYIPRYAIKINPCYAQKA